MFSKGVDWLRPEKTASTENKNPIITVISIALSNMDCLKFSKVKTKANTPKAIGK